MEVSPGPFLTLPVGEAEWRGGGYCRDGGSGVSFQMLPDEYEFILQ